MSSERNSIETTAATASDGTESTTGGGARSRSLHLSTLLAFLLGLGLVAGLVWSQGPAEILTLLAAAGWGVVWISAFRMLPLLVDTLAWHGLLQGSLRGSVPRLYVLRWVCESVNTLLPVAQVGGDVVRARLLARDAEERATRSKTPADAPPPAPAPFESPEVEATAAAGIPGNSLACPTEAETETKSESETKSGRGGRAGASVVVDFLLGLVGQGLYTLIAVVLLVLLGTTTAGTAEGSGAGAGFDLERTSLAIVAMAVLILLGIGGCYWALKRHAIDRLARRLEGMAGGRMLARVVGGAAALDAGVTELLNRRRTLLAMLTLKLGAWLLRSAEVWIALSVLGHPVGLAEAVVIEALASAIRSAAFAVPGAIGVQEGGILLVAGLLGVPPEIAVTLALMKRARELTTSLPGLLVWSLQERATLDRWLGGGGRGKPGGELCARG